MYRADCIAALENLKNGNFGPVADVQKTIDRITEALRSSVSFHVNSDYELYKMTHKNFNVDIDVNELWSSPYDLCFISAARVWNGSLKDGFVPAERIAIIVEKTDETVSIACFVFIHKRWAFCPVGFLFKKNSDQLWLRVHENLSLNITENLGDLYVESFGCCCWLAVSLFKALSCKNIVASKKLPPERLNKKRTKSGKEPLYTYHTLKVLLPSRRTIGTKADPTGRTVRLHLCRGHFKEYTTNRPLFGKYTGRYWWQPIARGDKKAGVVMKDYHVEQQGASK